jgi:S1-C subfamily serine protease
MMRKLSVDSGALVINAGPDSPAHKAGLQDGDVIVSMGGKEIKTAGELVRAIHDNNINEAIEIVYWRNDTKTTTMVTLVESPPPP